MSVLTIRWIQANDRCLAGPRRIARSTLSLTSIDQRSHEAVNEYRPKSVIKSRTIAFYVRPTEVRANAMSHRRQATVNEGDDRKGFTH